MVDLRLGDCLSILPTLATASVNAIVTDPPYGQSNEAYDHGVQSEVWRECFRVAAPDAALISFAGNPTYHRIASDIERAGWRIRQMWSWIFKDGLITSAWPSEGFDRLAPAMTPICYATKGKVLLELKREGEPWECWAERTGTGHSGRANITGKRAENGHWPRSVVASQGIDGFQYFALSNNTINRRDKTNHPNQKPIALMQWLLEKLPGGIVA